MTEASWVDFLLISPLLVIFVASLLPLTVSVLKPHTRKRPIVFVFCALIGLFSSAGLLLSFFGVQKNLFHKALIFDGLSIGSSLIILWITLFTLFFASESLSTATDKFAEFVFLLLNSALGMMIITWSNDLIVTFIGIEMTSLCLYILMALSREETLSKEAAFKYFVLSSFASAFFLYGVSFIYGSLGSTYLSEMAPIIGDLLSKNRLLLFAIGLVVMGLCFKVAVFPFHSWAPDVYQGAPTPLTGFMATGLKAAIFIALLRWVGTGFLLGETSQSLSDLIQWGAVLTMLAGNIAALLQSNFKRMLAYSSISHSGFLLMGLLAAGMGEERSLGAYGLLYYIFAYSLMTVGLFGVINLFEKRAGSEVNLQNLKGLASRYPWLALCVTIFLLSLAGLPPTVGFFAKLLVFYATVKQGLFWMAICAVVSTLIGVYYYLRPVIFMYKNEELEEDSIPKEGSFLETLESKIIFENESLSLQSEALSSRKLTCFLVFFSAFLSFTIGLALEPFYQVMVVALKNWL